MYSLIKIGVLYFSFILWKLLFFRAKSRLYFNQKL